ncbi:hypothetical protein P3W45_001512 [Vairimorpha bombi]
MNKQYDIILYGASGYAPRYIIPYLENTDLKIALAARNISKITDSDLPKIECSLEEVAEKTEILINCAGPYYETGEMIIKSCIENMTHYLDLCGEVHFMKHIMNKYHESAAKKKLFIIQGCGFDSVVSDLGTEYLKQAFDSDMEIRNIIEIKKTVVNTGTWRSLVESLSSYNKEKQMAQSSNKKTKEYFYDNESNGYVTKFRGTDHYMVSTTQRLMKTCNLPVTKFSVFLRIGSVFNLFTYYFYMSMIFCLSKFKFGKNMLLRFYRFFSYNFVKASPSDELIKKGSFSMKMEGVGSRNGQNIFKKLCITGPDPAYTTSGICISQIRIS